MTTTAATAAASTPKNRTYREVKVIGAGAFGKALLVEDEKHKQYCMKTVDLSRLTTDDKEKTLVEIKILESVRSHPFIIKYHHSYMQGKQLHIVMDYASGGDMHNRVKTQRASGKPFPESLLVGWLAQLLLGVKELHDKKILHRDIKSQNVFLSKKDTVLIGDFGISKALECTQACANTTIGTPYYLSPEVIKQIPYSYPSDVWAIGCLLYELAAFKVPFAAGSLKQLTVAISTGPIPKFPDCYSAEFRALGESIFVRDPARRPTIQQLLDHQIVQKELNNMLQKTNKSDRKQPVVAKTDTHMEG